MTNKYFLLILFLMVFLSACQDENTGLPEERKTETTEAGEVVKGMVRIKLTREFGEQVVVSSEQGVVQTRVASLDNMIHALGATSMVRTFPPAGEFEARTRAEGLHLWYDVQFDPNTPVTRVVGDLSALPGIAVVESVPKIVATSVGGILPAAALPFNDPRLPEQWHYNNDGSVAVPSVKGADINLFNAWKITKGSRNVIVAVVDGGIDYAHEDLAANMWVNEAEKSGTRNMDDDKNGFIDDVYGYNFVANTGGIIAVEHGTHVAGTIGAVNGNGKGVCGIAGGDASGNGVRLMSCQIFRSNPDSGEEESGSGARAIKYSADNGAVISQNSWGYDKATALAGSDKEAIDYFIKYAGIDKNGKQVGPMKGGVVIFAAGNENREIGFPASYEPVIAVASMAPDFTKAYYSNYGDWVDITAPGGSAYYNKGQVLSTLPGNKYGYMQGTSMACPHVSGVAALIVSKFGGQGFTPAQLKAKLLGSTKNIDQYNTVMYQGKLGRGYMDAAAALGGEVSAGIAPDAVKKLTAEASGNSVTVSWLVTADRDDEKAFGYTIYYAPHAISNLTAEDVKTKEVVVGELAVGASISDKVTGLDFGRTYYFVVVGYDRDGNRSKVSPEASAVTGTNRPPVITPRTGTSATVKVHETVTLLFDVLEPDGNTYSYALNDPAGAAKATQVDNVITVSVTGKDAPAGIHNATLTVTDVYGAKSEVEISYTILQNASPVVTRNMENVYLGAIGRQVTIDLSTYFEDADGEALTYTVLLSAPNNMDARVNGNQLLLTAVKAGETQVTVTAVDAAGATCSSSFSCMVRDGSAEVDLYPNPVTEVLNIRMGEEVDGVVAVSLYNSVGVKVMSTEVTLTPFTSGKLNVSSLSGGTYTIVIAYHGKEVKRNIVKL